MHQSPVAQPDCAAVEHALGVTHAEQLAVSVVLRPTVPGVLRDEPLSLDLLPNLQPLCSVGFWKLRKLVPEYPRDGCVMAALWPNWIRNRRNGHEMLEMLTKW